MRATTLQAMTGYFRYVNEQRLGRISPRHRDQFQKVWFQPADSHLAHVRLLQEHAAELEVEVSVIFDGALDEEFRVFTNSVDTLVEAVSWDCLLAYLGGDESREAGFDVMAFRPTHAPAGVDDEPLARIHYYHGETLFALV